MLCRIFSASIVAMAAFTALGAASAFAATTCSSVGACVLDVNSSSGPGIEGTSSTGEGVLGESFGTGTSTFTAVNAGVRGISRSGFYGLGLFGEGGVGAYGRGKVEGVYGEATGTSKIPGFNFGVFGSGQGGVLGFATGNKPGVIGLTIAGAGAGPNAFGVMAYGVSGTPGLFASGSSGIIAQSTGVISNGQYVPGAGAALQLETVVQGTVATLLRGIGADGKSVASLDSSGNLTLAGSLVQHGTPLVATSTTGGTAVMAYGSRTTSPSIEHVGEAKLVAGTALVSLDRGFASTIDASTPYLVFVTPEGDSRGLYVSERRSTGFVVRENAGGQSSTTFEYRIVARPLDAMQTQARAMRANSAAETATFEVHHPDIQHARPTDLSDHLPH